MAKKKRPQDLTGRNERHVLKLIAALTARVRRLECALNAFGVLQKQITLMYDELKGRR